MPETFLQDEEYAYPHGGQTRKGAAVWPDGKVRRVWAGIPDTFFTVPAHGRIGKRYARGFLHCPNGDNVLHFHVYETER